MEFKLTPFEWQMKAYEMSKSMPNLALYADIGCGKSGAAILICRSKYEFHGRMLNTLILAPLVVVGQWRLEWEKHSKVDLKHVIALNYKGKKRVEILKSILKDSHGKILIINYDALQNKEVFELLVKWHPEIIIADESHMIKSNKAKRSKSSVILADLALHKYILTGTPILNNVQDIFMQYRFLDGGETFGKSFYKFQSTYMLNENAQNPFVNFPKWVTNQELIPVLQKKIYAKAIRVTREECLKDLPDRIEITHEVELSLLQARMYKEMKNEFITYVEGIRDKKPKAVIAQIAATKGIRLQQIVTGFVTANDGSEIEFEKTNPRLEALRELLIELTPKYKVIIWCSFIKNYQQVARIFNELGIKYAMLTGEQNGRQKDEEKNRFKTDPFVRGIIANRKAGGIGIDLTEAAYSIIYSRDFSLGAEIQSDGRNFRQGPQIHKKIVKINLCANKTIDALIIKALNGKFDLAEMLIDNLKEL